MNNKKKININTYQYGIYLYIERGRSGSIEYVRIGCCTTCCNKTAIDLTLSIPMRIRTRKCFRAIDAARSALLGSEKKKKKKKKEEKKCIGSSAIGRAFNAPPLAAGVHCCCSAIRIVPRRPRPLWAYITLGSLRLAIASVSGPRSPILSLIGNWPVFTRFPYRHGVFAIILSSVALGSIGRLYVSLRRSVGWGGLPDVSLQNKSSQKSKVNRRTLIHLFPLFSAKISFALSGDGWRFTSSCYLATFLLCTTCSLSEHRSMARRAVLPRP